MLHHHARFAIKALLHLAAELALHLWLPALAHYTLPITALWLLVAAWRHVRATRLLTSATPPALPLPDDQIEV